MILSVLKRVLLLLSINLIINSSGQNLLIPDGEHFIWCTTSPEEFKKCNSFSQTVQKDRFKFGAEYLALQCLQAVNKDECMTYIDEDKAHITSLDAGDVFVGGRYHSLIPIMQESFGGNLTNYYAVAVIRKGTLPDVTNLRHLRGKKACFPGVGSLAGWVVPVHTLMREGGLEIVDCNNHVKSAIKYFGPSCAVNSLIDKYNPIGDNSDTLCSICIGRVPGEKCTPADPYAGFEGAFRCLVEAGEIAFLKHTTALEMTNSLEFPSVKTSDFELLCKDGSRRTVEEFQTCNWGTVPSNALVTTSAKPAKLRRLYQSFIAKAARMYGSPYNNLYNISTTTTNNPNQIAYEIFHLFESSPRYGSKHNLLFQDITEDLRPLEESKQSFSGYLGHSLDIIYGIRQCPVNSMTLCVTSDPELEKCIKMRIALEAQLLKPDLVCYKGHSQINCMQAIRNGIADVALFDAGDIYTAGLNYDLIPFLAEVYDLGVPEYYVVAVSKEEDPTTEITYLKGKYTCHPGINTAAGWIVPLAYLISNGWIRSYGCDSIRAAAEYFGKSCVPGSMSTEYNTGVPYDNMCHLCHGSSYKNCRRDASEDYYGYTGAFRCLVEGGGDVAFLKHTTVLENTDGKRREWWARNTLNEDFELLCPDGTRSVLSEYKRCNLGKVKANAVVTRGGEGFNITQLNAYINLFVYAQQFYGRKYKSDFSFSMFYSNPPYADLIFQDAAQQLMVLDSQYRYYSSYLGKDFMRARRIVDCHAGKDVNYASLSLTLLSSLLTTVVAIVIGRLQN
uniref:Transferrin-like domain-containing protein n=1 Tax=Clastoptera arizonana TaxID=38151 RepID=A0A1B6EA49_9HEMI